MWGRLVADVAHALLRAVSRHLLCSLTRCANHARGPGVEKSLDAARRSACATSATTCHTLAHPVSSTSGGLNLGLLFRIRISRPVVRGPGVANFDFSLFKNFQPTERIGVQLRAEAFNLANRVRFGFPNQNLSSGQIGVITGQADVPARFSSACRCFSEAPT